MKFLVSLFLLIPTQAFAFFCMGNPKVVSTQEFSREIITLPANGVLSLDLGTTPGKVTEVYRGKGTPFTGLNFNIEKDEEIDDRSSFWKWLRPKELRPPTYSLKLNLRDPYIKEILGIVSAATDVTVRVRLDNGRTLQGNLLFNSYLSANCQP